MSAVLVLNAGSSSLKHALFEEGRDEPLKRGVFEGPPDSLRRDLRALLRGLRGLSLAAVGHRLVHGGARRDPARLTPALLRELRKLVPLAPNHLPAALELIDIAGAGGRKLPQVACFDTAFHRRMDPVARRLPLPRRLVGALKLERYGFHGLSCEGVVHDLGPAAAGRLLIAHLGNGCSLTAVRDGRSVDTTMGLTPLGGLVMGTRPGDLDPGVPLHLLRGIANLGVEGLEKLLTTGCGLKGVSGLSADMRKLLASRKPQAAEAVDLFCRQALKHAGALAAVLGGLDTLVFTGGIGEHAAPVRERICAGLGFLGVRLDPARNAAHAAVISADGSAVSVRVMPASEERVIARHVFALLQGPPSAPGGKGA